MWAAIENNVGAVRAAGRWRVPTLGQRSHGGFTALLFAVRAGRIEAVARCSTSGANVNETMPDGTSALVLAIINAHYELAAVLVDRGADANADAQGWTPLHQLAWTRRPNGGLANPAAVPTGTLDSLDLAKTAAGARRDSRRAAEEGSQSGPGRPPQSEPDRRDAVSARGQSGRRRSDAGARRARRRSAVADRGSLDTVDGGGRRRHLERRRERRHERRGARGRQADARPRRRRDAARTTSAIPRCTAPRTAAPTPSSSCWSTRAPGSMRGSPKMGRCAAARSPGKPAGRR